VSRVLYLVAALLAGLAGLAFHVRNDVPVELDFYLLRLPVELSVALVAALVLGALLGIFAMTLRTLGLKRELARLRRQRAVAERELASLRTLTAKDAG